MNGENIQRGNIYNERIREFFPLFDKARKENDPIYNARVGFNTVRFLIEHPNWNEDENKSKAYEFILQECDKVRKARKELEGAVQRRLKDYIEGGIKGDGVKIYGNHVSITLEDNKKEFKISEFLNSDLCQKNGISGFSTLHSDGKSGMHGFIAEEEGKKVRHYTVTDGSYEMTLNWHVNGERCTVKINIDKDGVDLIGRNGVTDAQLQANKDVKIGGLFLYQIQFRERGKKQKSEIQKDSQSFETITRIDVSRDAGVQATTHMNRGFGSRTIISRSDSEGDSGYESQEESFQNESTPPPPPPRTSSLKEDVFDEKGENSSTKSVNQRQNKLSSNATDMVQKQSIENVLEEIEKGSQYNPARNRLKDKIEGKENNQNLDTMEKKLSLKRGTPKDSFSESTLEKIKEDKPIYKWLKDKIEGKENDQNLDVLEEKLPPKSGQGNVIEKRENGGGKPSPPTSAGGNVYVGDTQLQKGSYRSGQEPEEEGKNFQKISKAFKEWKENRRNARQSNSSFSSPIHASHGESQVNPKHLKAGPMNVEQAVTPENSNNEFKEALNRELEAEEKIEISSNRVCNEPGGQPIDLADQVMNELREALRKPGGGLKRLGRQAARTPVANSKNPFLEQRKHDKPIHRWLEKTLAERKSADKDQRHRSLGTKPANCYY